jgi:4-amino-4-deoxy-L-arabinose transferase-like glycosyltransferase
MIKNSLFAKLLTFFNLATLAILAALALTTAINPTVSKFGLFQPVILIFFGAVFVNIVLVILANIKSSEKYTRWLTVPSVILLFAALLIVELLFAKALVSTGYTWDTNIVFQAAVTYAQSGTVESGVATYFQSSPNNLALFYILSNLFSAMSHFGLTNFLWGAVLLNVAISFITQILVYFSVKLLYGRRVAFCSIFVSFVLIGLNLHIQTPYTDTLAILFPVLIFFLSLFYVKAKTIWMRLLLAFFIGAAAIVGTLVKPTVVIAVIALFIVAIVWIISEYKTIRQKKLWITIALSFIVFFATAAAGYFAYSAYVDHKQSLPYPYAQANKQSLPPQHFMNIGTKTKIDGYSVNYGGYDSDTANIVSRLANHDARVAYSNSAILTQLREYGLVGYVQFLAHKVMWIISDGTFFAFGEGDIQSVTYLNNDPLSQNLRQLSTPQGKYFLLFGNILQAFWLAMLLLIALQFMISILWKPARLNLFLAMLHLMIVGILVFLLAFEGRSRYLFLYLPIFIIAAMYTLNWFRNITREDSPQSIAKPPVRRLGPTMIDKK